LLRILAILSVAAAAWFALTFAGLTPITYTVPWAAYATFGWLAVNVVLLVRAIGRVRDLRYAGERRASVRFDTALTGILDGLPCRILDLSLTGARLGFDPSLLDDVSAAGVHRLAIAFAGHPVTIDADVRSARLDGRLGAVVGLEFVAGQHAARADLALALFATSVLGRPAPVSSVPAISALDGAGSAEPGVAEQAPGSQPEPAAA
jgi:hypothetical protein